MRRRNRIKLACEHCGKEYERPASRKYTSKYCSWGCQHSSMKKGISFSQKMAGMYNSGKSTHEIAKHFGISANVILNRLRELGVKIRTTGEASKIMWAGKSKRPSKKKLEKLYLDCKLSCEGIAEKYNVAGATVWDWLRVYGIPIRNPSEAELARFGIGIKRGTNVPATTLANEDLLVGYIIHNKEEFGYKDIHLCRTKDYDLLCITEDDKVEKVEVERAAVEALYEGHKCDRVIAYRNGTSVDIGIPVTLVNKEKFIKFAENVMLIKQVAGELSGRQVK